MLFSWLKKIVVLFYRIYRYFLRSYDFKKRDVRIAKGSYISRDTSVGDCTRINNVSYISECDIGAFCAIGGRLVVRGSNHSTNTINLQAWAQKEIIQSDLKVVGHRKRRVTIGNGVWIGDSVTVVPGACIGNGAVIGAGSVVTKSIPPYSVAVGNPAKVIRYRFPPEVIDLVKDIHWWDWDYKEIRRLKEFFEIDFENSDLSELETKLESLGVLGRGND